MLTFVKAFAPIKKTILATSIVLLVINNSSCTNKNKFNTTTENYTADAINAVLVSPAAETDRIANFPFVASRVVAIQKALSQTIPVLLLIDSLTPQQQQAQSLAIADTAFTKYCKNRTNKEVYRSEIFNIFPARQSDLGTQKITTPLNLLYRVELYNYALNLTTMSIVNLATNKVQATTYYPQTQPDIPNHLKTLALQIATNAPEVIEALGYTPTQTQALMANTQTALNRTKCERSRHLCVAPTFVKGNKALWAIVDLTEHKLVGVRWTNVGTTGTASPAITERKLQDDKVTACYCEVETKLSKNNWNLNYMLTSSDGLRVSQVTYKGVPVLQSAKLVDWHVSYSGTEGFGYSDAVGCPYFSQSAVVATSVPQVLELQNNMGFVIEQTYASQGWPTPCNYNYKQRFEFYNDGSFRISCASLGRGCGNDGTYRPVFRIAIAGNNTYSQYTTTNTWQPWATEQYTLQTEATNYNTNGAIGKITNTQNHGYYLIPSSGKFADGGRGDNAYIYTTLNLPTRDEGEADLPTIGPCCNTDYHQGPEKYINAQPENIENQPLVIWYVAQLKNDNEKGREYCWAESFVENGIYKTKSYPCYAGPLFVPIGK